MVLYMNYFSFGSLETSQSVFSHRDTTLLLSLFLFCFVLFTCCYASASVFMLSPLATSFGDSLQASDCFARNKESTFSCSCSHVYDYKDSLLPIAPQEPEVPPTAGERKNSVDKILSSSPASSGKQVEPSLSPKQTRTLVFYLFIY